MSVDRAGRSCAAHSENPSQGVNSGLRRVGAPALSHGAKATTWIDTKDSWGGRGTRAATKNDDRILCG